MNGKTVIVFAGASVIFLILSTVIIGAFFMSDNSEAVGKSAIEPESVGKVDSVGDLIKTGNGKRDSLSPVNSVPESKKKDGPVDIKEPAKPVAKPSADTSGTSVPSTGPSASTTDTKTENKSSSDSGTSSGKTSSGSVGTSSSASTSSGKPTASSSSATKSSTKPAESGLFTSSTDLKPDSKPTSGAITSSSKAITSDSSTSSAVKSTTSDSSTSSTVKSTTSDSSTSSTVIASTSGAASKVPISSTRTSTDPSSLSQKDVRPVTLPTSSTTTISTASVPIPDGLVHVTWSGESQPCGSVNSGDMVCGTFDINGLTNDPRSYRVFYAYTDNADLKKFIDSIEGRQMTNKDLLLSIRPYNYHYAGERKFYYLTKVMDRKEEEIGPTIESAVNRIKRSGFIGFYDDLSADDASNWKTKNILFLAPGPDFQDMKLFNAENMNLKTNGNGQDPIERPIYTTTLDKSTYLSKKIYSIRVREITNLFKRTGLEALYIEFKQMDNNACQFEFSIYNRFNLCNGPMKHTAYDGLDVYYAGNVNIIDLLDNIVKVGVSAEAERRSGGWLSSLTPFKVLLVGPATKFEKLKKI